MKSKQSNKLADISSNPPPGNEDISKADTVAMPGTNSGGPFSNRELIESLQGYCLFTTDLNGTIKTWNTGIANMLGHSEEEFVGKHCSFFISAPDDGPEDNLGNEMSTALNKGNAEFNRWCLKKNGEKFAADISINILKDHHGQLVGFSQIFHDITGRSKTEDLLKTALNNSERQKRLYEAVTGSTLDLIYVFDLSYRFIYANEALLNMWGSTWEAAIGKGLLENGYEPWHAEMHEREIDQVSATKQPVRGEVSFPHATQGRRIYDYLLVPVLNSKGEVDAVAGTTRDITDLKLAEEALKQSEEQFRTLTQSLPQLVWTADTEGYCDFFNQQWYDYTGSTPEKSYGNGWTQYIHHQNKEKLYSQWKHNLQTGDPIVAEFQLEARDGTTQWFYVLGNPIKDKSGMIMKWVGTLTNIDEQKAVEGKLEKLVNERTKELQRSNEDLQQFAHVASHDLKEPVRKMRTFSWRLRDEFGSILPEKANVYLNKVEIASERMYAMIDGILLYSSFRATEHTEEPVNLEELFRNVETDLEILLGQKSGIIKHENLPVINGSAVLLHQLFYNMVSNSLKFSRPDKSPVIFVTCSQPSGEDLARGHLNPMLKYIKITVKDNGIGFNQSDAEKIFQTFSRLNPKDKYEGTGLGLALCKKIVERYSGAIYADGEEGSGASFTILFPHNN